MGFLDDLDRIDKEKSLMASEPQGGFLARLDQIDAQQQNKPISPLLKDLGVSVGAGFPGVVSTLADVADMVTGDSIDAIGRFGEGAKAISNQILQEGLSPEALVQRQAIGQTVASEQTGIGDVLKSLVTNPLGAASMGAESAATMFVPMAGGLAAAKAAPVIGKVIPKVANALTPSRAAAIGATGSNALLNAGDTFGELEGQPLVDRYAGAAVPFAVSALLGPGVENMALKRWLGEADTPVSKGIKDAFSNLGKGALKGGAKEFVSEAGEGGSQAIGEAIGKGEEINPTQVAKQATLEGALGAAPGAIGGGLSNVKMAEQPSPVAQQIENTVAKLVEDAQQNQAQPEDVAANVLKALGGLSDKYEGAKPQEQAVDNKVESTEAPALARQASQVEEQAGVVDRASLQNRSRNDKDSLLQMRTIANNPDYGRVGYSRDFANGAPVVAYGSVPEEQKGRTDYAVTVKGDRIPVQYAVVEADSVSTSNDINGAENPDYGKTDRVTAIAGNGRVTGLAQAYRQGSAQTYRQELSEDSMHGVNPEVIAKMKNPVLVRIMPNESITDDIGDVSNTTSNKSLSAIEQARNDGRRINLEGLQFNEDGSVTANSLAQFVASMPPTERGALMDKHGRPSVQAVDRLNNAIFAKAYNNDDITAMYAQATDPEAKLIINALARLAPKVAKLEGCGELDFRNALIDAVNKIVQGKREGLKMQDIAAQGEMLSDPDVSLFVELFAHNSRSIKDAVAIIGEAADFAYEEATKSEEPDMLGDIPHKATRAELMGHVRDEFNKVQEAKNGNQANQQAAVQDASGSVGTSQDVDGRDAGANQGANERAGSADSQADEGFSLSGQTEQEIIAEAEAEEERQAQAEREAKTDAERQEAENLRKEVEQSNEDYADNFALEDDTVTGEDALRDQKPLFSRKSEINDPLVTLHNITENGLMKAARLGGLPAPSLAVSKVESPLQQFGEITLVGTKDLADPKKNPVFSVDAYTARFPKLDWSKSYKKEEGRELRREIELAQEQVGKDAGDTTVTYYLYYSPNRDEAIEKLSRSAAGAAMFLNHKGVKFNPVMRKDDPSRIDQWETEKVLDKKVKRYQSEFDAYIAKRVSEAFDEPRIVDGKKTAPLTLENVVRAMTRGPVRGAEKTFGNNTPGSIRARAAKQYKTMEELKADRDRVVSHDASWESEKLVDAKFTAFMDAVIPFWSFPDSQYSFAKFDAATEVLAACAANPTKANLSRVLRREGFENVDEETIEIGIDALKSARQVLTDYLEIKPQRAVAFSEFAGAVVPNTISAEARAVLEDAGLEIQTYNPKLDGGRVRATQRLINRLDRDRGDIKFSNIAVANSLIKSLDDAGVSENDGVYASFVEDVREELKTEFGEDVINKLESSGELSVVQTLDDLPEDIADIVSESRSAKNDDDANYRRGIQKLAEALRNKTSVKRAVYLKSENAWVDFEWGKLGSVLDWGSYQTKGAMGLLHFIDKRSVTKQYSPDQVAAMLCHMVRVLVEGKFGYDNQGRTVVTHKGFTVSLGRVWVENKSGKKQTGNHYVITGYGQTPAAVANLPSGLPGKSGPIPDTSIVRVQKNDAARERNVATLTDIIVKNGLIFKYSEDGEIQGLYDPKTKCAYLIAANIEKGHANGVFLHELGVHASYGKNPLKLESQMKLARNMVNNGYAQGNDIAVRVKERLFEAGEIDSMEAPIPMSAAEETMAYLVEETASTDNRGPFRKWFDSVIAAIKQWLRDHGINVKLNEWDFVEFAKGNVTAMAKQSGKDMALSYSKKGKKLAQNKMIERKGPSEDVKALRDNDKKEEDFPFWKVWTTDEMGNLRWEFGRLASGTIGKTKAGKAVGRFIGNAYEAALVATKMKSAPKGLRMQLRAMKAQIEQAGIDATEIAKVMQGLTAEERSLISDYIENEMKADAHPAPYIVEIATKLTDILDQQADELVELGMLSKESRDRYRGHYLPRKYNKNKQENFFAKIFGTKGRLRGVAGGHLKGRGVFETVPVEKVGTYISQGFEVRDPEYVYENGKVLHRQGRFEGMEAHNASVRVWRDFTRAEREEMGEIRDASFRFAVGYMDTQRDLALGRLFKEIASDPSYTSSTPREGFEYIPKTEIPETEGVYKYGALAGKYVDKTVLSHLAHIESAPNDFTRAFRQGIAFWKEGKTAMNPVSHMNNTVGNLTAAHFAGVYMWDVKTYNKAFNAMRNANESFKEAQKAGLFTGSFSQEEFVKSLPQELQANVKDEDGWFKSSSDIAMKILTWGMRDKMRKAYELEDSFFKMAIYVKARERGLSPAEAVDYAHQYVFVYDTLPQGARAVRDWALPFFAWTYQAVPMLANTMAHYPHRLLVPALVLHAINKAFYMAAIAMASDEDEDWITLWKKASQLEDDVQETMPDYMQGYSALLTPKFLPVGINEATGLPRFWDMSHLIPGGNFLDMNNQAGGLPLPEMIVPSHPVLNTFMALIGNRDSFSGRELYKDSDTDAEMVETTAGYLWKQLSPALAVGNYHWSRLLDGIATETGTPILGHTGVTKGGETITFDTAVMRFMGMKVRDLDAEKNANTQINANKYQRNEIKGNITRARKDYARGAMTKEALLDYVDSQREKLIKLAEESRKMAEAKARIKANTKW